MLSLSLAHAIPPSMCNNESKVKLTDKTATFYAQLSANLIFTFNFVSYNNILASASTFFDKSAWQQVNDYLKSSRLLALTKKNKLILSAFFNEKATILSQTANTWRIQVPLIISIQSASEKKTQKTTVTMDISYDKNQTTHCGLSVTKIKFNPPAKQSRLGKFKDFFGNNSIAYQHSTMSKSTVNKTDLTQPLMNDLEIITFANRWLLDNKNKTQLDGPLIILQKGILNKRYTWRVRANKNQNMLLFRSNSNPDGLEILQNKSQE
jgi:Type-IV b secretion system, inner-membrane complex component